MGCDIKQRGQVDWAAWINFRRSGNEPPAGWDKTISGPGIVHIPEVEAVAILNEIHGNLEAVDGQAGQDEFDRQARAAFGVDDLSQVIVTTGEAESTKIETCMSCKARLAEVVIRMTDGGRLHVCNICAPPEHKIR